MGVPSGNIFGTFFVYVISCLDVRSFIFVNMNCRNKLIFLRKKKCIAVSVSSANLMHIDFCICHILQFACLSSECTSRWHNISKPFICTFFVTQVAWVFLTKLSGISDLYVHVAVNNEPAKNLYMKSGFTLESDEPAWQARFLDRPRRLLLWTGLPITYEL